MNYPESLDYIHSLLKFGIRPGLARMDTLLALLGNPHEGMKYVHVAGTNGKGSVSTAVSCILTSAGYKTGLYTSPYVTDFLERVQFNGKPVEKALFAESVAEVKEKIDIMNSRGEDITEFEALTAAAFLCYKKLGCDIVVLEVGLGGRLDATNVIPAPLVNIITSLSLDHTAILGDTIEKIAFEKCGTVKDGGSVVSAANQPEEALAVIKKTAAERGNSLVVPDLTECGLLSSSIRGIEFSYKGKRYQTSMPGYHQLINMTAVIEAANILKDKGFALSDEHICGGIAAAKLPARCEVIADEPLVILDGGHNEDGARAFYNMLVPALEGRAKLYVIAGMLADKAVEASLKRLCSRADVFIAVTPKNPRAMQSTELCSLASQYCGNTLAFNDVSEAISYVKPLLTERDTLCVVGSLYLAGEARVFLKQIF